MKKRVFCRIFSIVVIFAIAFFVLGCQRALTKDNYKEYMSVRVTNISGSGHGAMNMRCTVVIEIDKGFAPKNVYITYKFKDGSFEQTFTEILNNAPYTNDLIYIKENFEISFPSVEVLEISGIVSGSGMVVSGETILYIVAIVLAIGISIPIWVAISRGKRHFINRAEKIVKGMTLQEVTSIMERLADSVEGQKYKWEKTYWTGYGFATNTLYITVIFEKDIVIIIDKNF